MSPTILSSSKDAEVWTKSSPRKHRYISMDAICVWILTLMLSVPCYGSSGTKGQSAGGGSFSGDGAGGGIFFAGDPFVAAAPLIVAAVCSDGIAIVATHTAFSNEPLILDEEATEESIETATSVEVSDAGGNANATNPDKIPRDLPRSYRGPFRINAIDGFGTCLVSAGWRADGDVMAYYCRALASEELNTFGKPAFINCDYGNFIASEASLFMAQCASSESRRSLSCASLLASSGDENSGSPGGYLWLIDATGAYRVRAHAIGGGVLSPTGGQASVVNEELSKKDFSALTKEQGTKELLTILSKKAVGLPAETRVEIATVNAKPRRTMKRLFSSSLFGVSA